MTTADAGLSAEDILEATEPKAQETSGTEEVVTETPEATHEKEEATEVKEETKVPLFTDEQQEAVNKIVQSRLAKERNKSQTEMYALKQKLEALQAGNNKQPEMELEDFGGDLAAYNKYQIQQETQSQLQQYQMELAKQQQAQYQAAQFENEWNAKVEAYKARAGVTDYQEKVTALGASIPNEAVLDLMDSDMGPDLAYHLANNYAEAEKYASMNQRQRDRYIARMEMTLSQPAPAAPAPIKPVSKAPAPPTKPVGEANKGNAVSLDDWMKQRNSEAQQSNFF